MVGKLDARGALEEACMTTVAPPAAMYVREGIYLVEEPASTLLDEGVVLLFAPADSKSARQKRPREKDRARSERSDVALPVGE